MLESLRQIVGLKYVLTQSCLMAPYLLDKRNRYFGDAIAIVLPANTDEVSQIVQLCKSHRISIVPQGGNTGLCGGAVPNSNQILLSLIRLNKIRALDINNQTITAEAGCTLRYVQKTVQAKKLHFGINLASEETCTIGGNLSTNAGGISVLRYGNIREQCLGLEVVTPDGRVWNGLRLLRKDNSGYCLRDLYIGAEGTLGVITAATLKLNYEPISCESKNSSISALFAIEGAENAIDLLNAAKQYIGPLLTAFELISESCLSIPGKEFIEIKYKQAPIMDGFSKNYPYFILLELTSFCEEIINTKTALEKFIRKIQTQSKLKQVIQEFKVAKTTLENEYFWAIRKNISAAQAALGRNIKHDISLPISYISDFIMTSNNLLKNVYPDCQIFIFGHVGDGNIHYNVAGPNKTSDIFFLKEEAKINTIVYNCVNKYYGSISAEHGIGKLKVDTLKHYKSKLELELMRSIKNTLDPYNLMNPGKIL